MKQKIWFTNKIQTPDGTLLESTHIHDYKTHEDEVSGEVYMTDGLGPYVRRTVNIVPYVDLSVTTESSHEEIREVFTWGTYGKDGKQPRTEVKLKDMSTEHIEAILLTQKHIFNTYAEDLFINELEYRKE
jgi:hypothetical protein